MLVDARQGKQGENRDIGRRRLNFFGIISGHVDFFYFHSFPIVFLTEETWMTGRRKEIALFLSHTTNPLHTTPPPPTTHIHTHTHTTFSFSPHSPVLLCSTLPPTTPNPLFLTLSNHTQTQPVYIPSIILLSIPPDERLDCPFRRPSLILVVCCCDPTAFGLVLPSSPSV